MVGRGGEGDEERGQGAREGRGGKRMCQYTERVWDRAGGGREREGVGGGRGREKREGEEGGGRREEVLVGRAEERGRKRVLAGGGWGGPAF